MDAAVERIKQAGVDLRRHRFDVDQYRRMAEVGILLEDDPVELIERELIEMSAACYRTLPDPAGDERLPDV